MRRGLVVTIGAGIAASTATVALLATRDVGSPAERAARDACAHVDSFTRIVDTDGPVSRATAELDRALRSARRASSLDVRWIGLESGVQTLQVALVHDDPGAADQGLAVVRGQCREAK